MDEDEKDPREAAYDEKINPLMAQIIDICKEHKIAFLANFLIGGSEEPEAEESPYYCSTFLLGDEFTPSEKQLEAYRVLAGRRSSGVMAITISRNEAAE